MLDVCHCLLPLVEPSTCWPPAPRGPGFAAGQ